MIEIITTLITAVASITTVIISKKTNKKVETIQELKNEFKEEIQTIQKEHRAEMDNHILEADKTFLTNFLSDIEQNIPKTEIQKMRGYEVYEEYTEKHGNSYIHDKWDELVKTGKL